jgi:hypothetical protein
VARRKDRATDVEGSARHDVTGAREHHPTHRATRILVLSALALVVVAYLALEQWQQHQNPDRSVDAYCHQVGGATGLDDALANLDGRAAQTAFDQLEALDRVAPSEIEPQLRTVVEASRPLVQVLQAGAPDQEQAMRQVLQARQGDAARVDAAAKAVTTYTTTTCHVPLDPTVSESTPSSVAGTSSTTFAPPKATTSSTAKAVAPPRSTVTSAPTR